MRHQLDKHISIVNASDTIFRSFFGGGIWVMPFWGKAPLAATATEGVV